MLTVLVAQHVTVDLFDVLGRRLQHVFDADVVAEDSSALTISTGDLPAGVYVVRAEGERVSVTRTLTVVSRR